MLEPHILRRARSKRRVSIRSFVEDLSDGAGFGVQGFLGFRVQGFGLRSEGLYRA